MKKKQTKNLELNEVRVIKLDRAGIEEILLEVLSERGMDIFDIDNQEVQYKMLFNDDLTELVYMVYRFSHATFKPACNVDKAISEIEIIKNTTDSIYTSNRKKKYISLNVPL